MSSQAVRAWLIAAVLVLIGSACMINKIKSNECADKGGHLATVNHNIAGCVDPSGSPIP